MTRYKVYHKDNPNDYEEIEYQGYYPMRIKSLAIGKSDSFHWSDYTSLRVKKIG